ncbi:nucleotidyltransferase family protein [Neobacillus niacini]|uniref:nucleotidyltransferase family protein n=1 Tax=Neobacillus niacini TaxID=86668 RepID=UPI0007AC10C4|nr:nucleotidyltransferase family protein [Neobacillus niacini]MEC1521254.1 nucleotidyltransferase family protein [Neobacillus niacini]
MPRIGAIILAAGLSKRMGHPKLLLPLNGKPLFRYPLEQAIRNHLQPICLIAGQHLQAFQTASSDLVGVEYIYNRGYEQGMSSSLKIGIENIKDCTDAAFIFLADQPFVPDLVVQSMIEEFGKDTRIVRPQYQGNFGHPILIDKSLYDEFLKLEGDQGGKAIINNYKSETKILTFDHPFWGMDIDTPEEYRIGEQRMTANIPNL